VEEKVKGDYDFLPDLLASVHQNTQWVMENTRQAITS
jgi:hypothetical protein